MSTDQDTDRPVARQIKNEAASAQSPPEKRQDPDATANETIEVPPTLGGLIAAAGQGLGSAYEGMRDWTEQQQRETLEQILSSEEVDRLVNILNIDRRVNSTIRERLGADEGAAWSLVAAFADSAIPAPLATGYRALRAKIFRQAEQLQQLHQGEQLETEDTQN